MAARDPRSPSPDARPARPLAARLVSTSWLAGHLDDPGLRLVDLRWGPRGAGRRAYRAEHIPGAIHLDWARDLCDPGAPVRYLMLDPGAAARLFAASGIGATDHVVAYAEAGEGGPYRLWWTLGRLGHRRVSVLDGGITRWRAEGRPLTSEPARRRPARLPLRRPAVGLAGADEVAGWPASGVLDARPPEQHAGRAIWTPRGSRPVDPSSGVGLHDGVPLRGGRIPGSLNVPADRLFGPDGRMLGCDRVRALLRDRGVPTDRPIVAYCGVGIAASTLLFALRRAGWRDLALYDASWEEWGADGRRPVEHDRDRRGA